MSGRCHCAYDNKLSSHFHFRFLIDTSVSLRCRFASIPMRPETSACFSEPSMPGCCASSSNRTGAILTGTFFPPIRGRSRQHSTPTAVLYYPSATLAPTPGRCAVRRLTASLRQCRRPLHSLRAAHGLGQGQAGLLSAVQAPRQKACRSAALHDTCHLL